MSESIEIVQLHDALQRGKIQWQRHALEQMLKRAISREVVCNAITQGECKEKVMKGNTGEICPLCKGKKTSGTTTFAVDLGFGVFVVRDVPALVCSQCGTDWLTDDVAAYLENLVEDARRARRQVDVTPFAY